MLNGGEHSAVQHPSEQDKQAPGDGVMDIAISPLAMPIFAGPGTIATAMGFATDGGLMELAITITAFVALCVITWLCFVSGETFVKFLGNNGLKVITRLMGLILAEIGVQMLIDGVTATVAHLSG